MTDRTDRPNKLPWPPMLLAVHGRRGDPARRRVAAAVVRHRRADLLGVLIVAIGLGLDGWAIVTMRGANTNIMPNRAADLLVTWGPFRFSRNPIYLGNTLLLIGIGIAGGNYWFVARWHWSRRCWSTGWRSGARRSHLAARFGEAWTNYAQTTPRWLI